MAVRDKAVAEFEGAAAQQGRLLRPPTDALPLLDSRCFAIVVARLGDRLGRDPFSDGEGLAFPVPFAGFVSLHETAGA